MKGYRHSFSNCHLALCYEQKPSFYDRNNHNFYLWKHKCLIKKKKKKSRSLRDRYDTSSAKIRPPNLKIEPHLDFNKRTMCILIIRIEHM